MMSLLRLSVLYTAPVMLAACAATMGGPTLLLPATDVQAVGETAPVGTANADAADDPAIWRNAANPAASIIIGTDKRAGLYSYALDGRQLAFAPAGELNNVDLRDGVRWAGRDVILVGASDRTSLSEPRLALFLLDPATGALQSLGSLPTGGRGEAYGFCFGRRAGTVPHGYVVTKQGEVQEIAIREEGGVPHTALERRFGVLTQPEGCVVDDRTGQLYLGEEDTGIWRFDLTAAAPRPILFAQVGAEDGLVADVEGLALAPRGADGGVLLASSQGDNAYALFSLPDARLIGRFRIADGPIDGTFDTDGIDLALGDFGPRFPHGLLVVQDGDNRPEAQNFKLLDWGRILSALGLD